MIGEKPFNKNYLVTGKFFIEMELPSTDLLEKMRPAIESIDLSRYDSEGGEAKLKGKGVEMIEAQSTIKFAIIAELPILARNAQDAITSFYRQSREVMGKQLDKSMDVETVEVVGVEYVSDAT